MNSKYAKLAILVLIAGLLAACGSQTTDTPTSQPSETVAPATEAPTEPPAAADTSAPTATESAAATQPAAEGATISFANDVMPIFESRCIGCHGGERTQEGLDLKTHGSLMAGSENGSVITPGDAADSKLVDLVATQKMPKRGPKLTPDQVQIITDWINQGALDN